MADFVLREILSERREMLSVRDMARLSGADVHPVIVSLEERCILRRMITGFVYGSWCPFFAAAWQPTLFFKPLFSRRRNLSSMTRGLEVRCIPVMY